MSDEHRIERIRATIATAQRRLDSARGLPGGLVHWSGDPRMAWASYMGEAQRFAAAAEAELRSMLSPPRDRTCS